MDKKRVYTFGNGLAEGRPVCETYLGAKVRTLPK